MKEKRACQQTKTKNMNACIVLVSDQSTQIHAALDFAPCNIKSTFLKVGQSLRRLDQAHSQAHPHKRKKTLRAHLNARGEVKF